MKCLKKSGFTLIELLIVVAIIAILAAIAVPNFLEAQTRSKLSRVKADMRTLDIGLTCYYTDLNKYPTEAGTPISPKSLYVLTSPVAYLASADSICRDPFQANGIQSNNYHPNNIICPYFFYCDFMSFARHRSLTEEFNWNGWGISSLGPDKNDDGILCVGFWIPSRMPGWEKASSDTVYDPSNGTVSWGDISRWGGQVPSDVIRLVGYK